MSVRVRVRVMVRVRVKVNPTLDPNHNLYSNPNLSHNESKFRIFLANCSPVCGEPRANLRELRLRSPL